MSFHQAARDYATRGWRVFPVRPGTKHPAIQAWQTHATTDPAQIDRWWTQTHVDHSIGIATGPESGIWALDIDCDDQTGKHGDETLADLEGTYGPIGATLTAITPRGGQHRYYLWPAGQTIRNSASGVLGPDLDVRGAGGFIVAAPSVGTNGYPYEWDLGNPSTPVDAPAWMVGMLTTRPAPTATPLPAHVTAAAGDRPGDLWAAATPWSAILEADGWTLEHIDHTGEHHWTRPGKDIREGASATTGYTAADTLHVFTSSMRAQGLNPEETYTKLGYVAAVHFRGDHAAAARHLAAQGWTTNRAAPAPTPVSTPAAADHADDLEGEGWPIATFDQVDAILSGNYTPPVPEILRRSDGAALLYRGRVHSIAGEPGGGKTWVALAACAQVMADDANAVIIDYEDRLDTAITRLLTLGVDPNLIRKRFRYITPTFAIRGGRAPSNVINACADADLVVIDSMGEALSHSELDQNSDSDVRSWFDGTARPLADNGAAVLILDHVTKDTEHRGRWAIGSQRKLAAISGVAYQMVTVKAATKDSEGRALIKCSKDRLGNYMHSSTVADVRLTPTYGGGLTVHIDAAVEQVGPDGALLLTGYMERISRYLEGLGDGAEVSARHIEQNVTGKGPNLRTALGQLVALGHITTTAGATGYTLTKPYRETEVTT